MSKSSNWAQRQLKRAAEELGGELRRSQRRVPHLVIPFGGEEASIAWFCGTKTYRLFFPWPSFGRRQEMHDFKRTQDLCAFVKEKS